MCYRNFLIRGFTLIEMLVVISVFSIIAVLVGSLVGRSMKGARKSESSLKVRAELENAVSIIERSLRGAKANSVSCTPTSVNFTGQDGQPVSFSCSVASSNFVLKKGNYDIVGSNVKLTACNFDCSKLSEGIVGINLSGVSANSSGVESDSINVSARVVLRNY